MTPVGKTFIIMVIGIFLLVVIVLLGFAVNLQAKAQASQNERFLKVVRDYQVQQAEADAASHKALNTNIACMAYHFAELNRSLAIGVQPPDLDTLRSCFESVVPAPSQN